MPHVPSSTSQSALPEVRRGRLQSGEKFAENCTKRMELHQRVVTVQELPKAPQSSPSGRPDRGPGPGGSPRGSRSRRAAAGSGSAAARARSRCGDCGGGGSRHWKIRGPFLHHGALSEVFCMATQQGDRGKIRENMELSIPCLATAHNAATNTPVENTVQMVMR